MVNNSKQSPIRTRRLTQRECLYRALLHTMTAFAMAAIAVWDRHELGHALGFLGVAALNVTSARPWWKWYLLLRRGNYTTGFNFLGIISKSKTVTTIIEIPDPPPVHAIAPVLATGLLTVMALCWGVLSIAIITSPRKSILAWLIVQIANLPIVAFTVYCWKRVGRDLRPPPTTTD